MKKILSLLIAFLLIAYPVFPATLEMDWMEYSSNANAQAAYVSNAYGNTGGTITTDGLYTVHKFTGNGTFTPIKAGNVEYLVVAGGGAGGSNHGGGGGAGGYKVNAAYAVTAQAYTVTIGAAGASSGYGQIRGGNGGNSVFGAITATGGGGGGARNDAGSSIAQAGGSGGGGGGDAEFDQIYGGAASPPGEGYAGGDAQTILGAGGGGSSGVGAPGSGTRLGGSGTANDILVTGSYVTYAVGGDGNDGSTPATPAAGGANTGDGGDGGKASSGAGAAGGSGIVIIRYLTADFLNDAILQSYSESTIKTQGTYSLKGVAAITDSLNKTLTKTFAANSNLTGVKNLKFDIRASRTGSNIKIGIYEGANMRSEITPVIATADTFQTVNWDLSAVSDANKDAIDKIIITITNADAANTFYIDNFEIAQAIDVFGYVN